MTHFRASVCHCGRHQRSDSLHCWRCSCPLPQEAYNWSLSSDRNTKIRSLSSGRNAKINSKNPLCSSAENRRLWEPWSKSVVAWSYCAQDTPTRTQTLKSFEKPAKTKGKCKKPNEHQRRLPGTMCRPRYLLSLRRCNMAWSKKTRTSCGKSLARPGPWQQVRP